MRISDWSSDVCSSDLGIALADEEHDRRGVGRAAVGQALLPILRQHVGLLRDRIDVIGKRQRDDIGFEPVDHRARLLARTAVAHVDRHALPMFGLPLRGERGVDVLRSEEHTSELQSLMRISYAVFCLNKKIYINITYQLALIIDMPDVT